MDFCALRFAAADPCRSVSIGNVIKSTVVGAGLGVVAGPFSHALKSVRGMGPMGSGTQVGNKLEAEAIILQGIVNGDIAIFQGIINKPPVLNQERDCQ